MGPVDNVVRFTGEVQTGDAEMTEDKTSITICPHCGQDSGGVFGSLKHVSETVIEHYCVVCGKTSHKTVEAKEMLR